jgi:hypothetical protein
MANSDSQESIRRRKANDEKRRKHPRFVEMKPDDPDATPKDTTRVGLIPKRPR